LTKKESNCELATGQRGNHLSIKRGFTLIARVSTHPADKIDELLPSEWKKLNTKPDEDADGDAAIAIKVA
jgi:hypothetical protein